MTNLPPDLTPERPVRSEYTLPRTYRIRRMVTCAVIVVLVAGIGYGMYAFTRAPAEIPFIKAEGPLKVKPEQPGGIDIPNQDVLAYQQIDNSGNKTPVEHLLPPPETPQIATPSPAPNSFAAPSPKVEALTPPPPPPAVTTVTREKTLPPPSQAGLAPAPEAAPRSPVIAADGDNTASPPSPAPEQRADTAASTESNGIVPASIAAKPGRKGFRIQLASFPDLETARSQLAHMEKKYAGQLGETKLHLTKADLGPRGIYYRVQSNPITDTEAHDICGALTKIKAGCIVVKP